MDLIVVKDLQVYQFIYQVIQTTIDTGILFSIFQALVLFCLIFLMTWLVKKEKMRMSLAKVCTLLFSESGSILTCSSAFNIIILDWIVIVCPW